MLTRLRVSGFKNLVDVDVRFGPFTCIAGINGVGKSNLFDAIRFLSALADQPLVDAALAVRIDRDERRELLTLFVAGRDKTPYPARALSDGTLRFLALSVLALDPRQRGVICLEEPENGIHPDRLPAILQLLSDIAVDAQHPVDAENPLRQVIINTHSPAVVQQVPEESLLVAEARDIARNGALLHGVRFAGLPDTWRIKEPDSPTVSLGRLLSYLHPVAAPEVSQHNAPKAQTSRRVIDRNDLRDPAPTDPHRKRAARATAGRPARRNPARG